LKNTPNKTKPVTQTPPLEGQGEALGLIYLLGYMASGKTTIGKKLANALQYEFIDLDALIEQHELLTVTEIFTTKGEDYFRQLEREILHQTAALQNTVISCGGGTPCFYDNIDFINSNGLSIWLNPPLGFIIDRIKKEPNQRPLVIGLQDEALKNKIETHYNQRVPYYNQAKIEYNAKLTKEADFIKQVREMVTQ
jgi:shikimate kinase